MKYRISTPNQKFEGRMMGVQFVSGVGYTTDKRLASYFEDVWDFQVKAERKKKGDLDD